MEFLRSCSVRSTTHATHVSTGMLTGKRTLYDFSAAGMLPKFAKRLGSKISNREFGAVVH